MLSRANLGFKKITKDTDNFSLVGMIEPTFYNFGTENVRVLHSIIKPGESFLAGVTGMEMNNEIPITFDGANTAGRNLMCYYGTHVSNC